MQPLETPRVILPKKKSLTESFLMKILKPLGISNLLPIAILALEAESHASPLPCPCNPVCFLDLRHGIG